MSIRKSTPVTLGTLVAVTCSLVAGGATAAGAGTSAGTAGNAGGRLVLGSEAGELFLAEADGSAERPVAMRVVAGAAPRWSPDGRKIAFLAERGGRVDLYLIGANGEADEQLTFGPAPEGPPAWGRGNQILFARGRGRRAEIYALTPGTGLERRLTRNRFADTDPDVSPYGVVAFASTRDGGRPRLYRMLTNGSRVAPLTSRPGGDSAPAWSPSGRVIAFVRGGSSDRDLFVVGANGKGLRRVTATPTRRESSPRWSADGSRIVFRGCEAAEGGDTCGLFAVNPDGTDEQPLAVGPGLAVKDFDVQRAPLSRTWNAAADFQRDPYQRNPSADAWGDLVWSYHERASLLGHPLLTHFAFPPQSWGARPYTGPETYASTAPFVGSSGPGRPLFAHPHGPRSPIIVWRSPIAGAVDVTGSIRPVSLEECGFNGDGVGAVVEKDATPLAVGRMRPGVEWRFELQDVGVAVGTTLRFTVDAGEYGDSACDTTVLDIAIRQR